MSSIIEQAATMISQFEGCSLKAYPDPAGIWTIGYGSRYINGVPITKNQVITKDEALSLLESDVTVFYNQINNLLPSLSENQLIAILDFVYNIGFYAFKNSTMCKLIQQGKMADAAEQFDSWVYAKGKKIPGLVRRREAEKTLFLKG